MNKRIAKNKKAFFNYEVLESLEAGIKLFGTEVKSLRSGNVSFGDAYARIRNNEVWLVDLHISPYEFGNRENHDPTRERKLLLHKREIRKLKNKLERQGLTLVPVELYFNDRGLAKVALGVCRGRKRHDKRQAMKKREDQRRMERIQ